MIYRNRVNTPSSINTLPYRFATPGTVGNLLTSDGTAWVSGTPAPGTTIGFGTTGLTPSVATGGVVAVAGTLVVANGGTGVTTSTGTGAGVHQTNPALVTPDLGTPTALVATNATGTATALNAGIGVGQTWQNMGRSAGVTYTNSTSKPIYVLITCISGPVTITGTVDGLGFYSGIGAGSFYNASTIYLIVPVGSTYSTNSFGAGSPSWFELR